MITFCTPVRKGLLLVALLPIIGCSGPQIPPADEALKKYVQAVKAEDSAVLHQMMTRRARKAVSEAEVGVELTRNRKELRARTRLLLESETRSEGAAILFLRYGRRAELSLENQAFFLNSTAGLPPRPQSVEQALALFREALRSRDFHRLLSLLSVEARGEIEESLSALDESLSRGDSAIIDVREDEASIKFSDGLALKLRRRSGVWKIGELR